MNRFGNHYLAQEQSIYCFSILYYHIIVFDTEHVAGKNTRFIRDCGSFENHAGFQTIIKGERIYTRLQAKTAQTPFLWGTIKSVGGFLSHPPVPGQNSPKTILIFAVEYKQIFAVRIKMLILIPIGFNCISWLSPSPL